MDECNIHSPLKFYTASDARSNPDGQLTVHNRTGKIFERVKKRHGKIFDANDEIKLSPCSLALGQHTIRCNDHLCVRGIRLVLYAARYESSNRKNFL